MNKYCIIISIVLTCFIGITNAQSDLSQPENLQKESKRLTLRDTSIITYELRADIQTVIKDIKMKALKNKFEDSTIVMLFDTASYTLSLSIDTTKVILSDLKTRLSKKGYILLYVEKEEVSIEVKTEPSEKYDPAIDRFLNIEDTTIFTSKFVRYDTQQIHPSRRNYYQVIEKIHDLNEKLESCENNILDSTVNKVAEKLNITLEAARLSLLEATKGDFRAASTDLRELVPFAKEWELLSPIQKQYYEGLKNKINSLSKRIFPDQP